MPIYTYKALNRAGELIKGRTDGGSRASVLDELSRAGHVVLELSELSPGGDGPRPSWANWTDWASFVKPKSNIAVKHLAAVTQSLATLLKAGLTIDRGLRISIGIADNKPTANFLASVASSIRSGRSFSEALSDSSFSLPSTFIAIVQAGELGGYLPEALARLSELLQRQNEVRERIRSALIYPALLSAMVLLTIVLLVGVVLPRFKSLFAESDAELPLSTRVVLAMGDFVGEYWLALLCGSVAIGLGASLYLRSPSGKSWRDQWLLRSRLVFGIPLAIEAGRFLRTLGALAANGVPIPNALRLAQASLSNSLLQESVKAAAKEVAAGRRFSDALGGSGAFPAYAVQLARVGEETGRLDELLLQAAVIAEQQAHTRLERILALMVPLLTVFMGAIVAALIGSVLVGLLSINDIAL